jgi:hypothetical protein
MEDYDENENMAIRNTLYRWVNAMIGLMWDTEMHSVCSYMYVQRITYSSPWSERPLWWTTTCFTRPLFHAWIIFPCLLTCKERPPAWRNHWPPNQCKKWDGRSQNTKTKHASAIDQSRMTKSDWLVNGQIQLNFLLCSVMTRCIVSSCFWRIFSIQK